MLKGQGETRMIWLMVLMIVAVVAWFSKLPMISYVCAAALVMSVIQYIDAIEKPTDQLSEDLRLAQQNTSKVPLYLSSIMMVVGGILHWQWLLGIGVSLWIFFLLRWLQRLEIRLQHLQQRVQQQAILQNIDVVNTTLTNTQNTPHSSTQEQFNLKDQVSHWLFSGNPVLKVAIIVLVIGVILLLRFATEHWQLSLAMKLGVVALSSAVVSALGVLLQKKNRSFAIALEGLGLAGLFLTLFFAYYNGVIASLLTASLCFVVIMALTLTLSLKQKSVELALMAMTVAYIAPFTLPVRDATAVEMVAYYLVINVAVAILTTLRPWKFLNQIAFLMTALVGAGYAFLHSYTHERGQITALLLAHTVVFIWLGFRFSQLLAHADLAKFKLKPALDIALIFAAPIVAYGYLYLMYFDESQLQAALSLLFAAVFAGLYFIAKKHQRIAIIAQSYFSLSLIFLVLIPPILLPEHWSVTGWAVEGALIFIFALYQQSNISRYLAMGLLIMAGLSSLYYVVELNRFPREMYWSLVVSYFAVVGVANSSAKFRQQVDSGSLVFHCVQMFSATIMLFILMLDYIDSQSQVVLCLLIISIVYVLMNEGLLYRKAAWTWLLPKWMGLIPVYIVALVMVVDLSEQGQIIWHNSSDRFGFALTGILLTFLWLRPMLGGKAEREWVALGVMTSLALTSVTLFPSMPYLSVVILALLFCAWCYFKQANALWHSFWQARSTLVLMATWMICSQLFSQQAFYGYILPILNPFDAVSIAMLAAFLWMLGLQSKAGLDKGIVAVLMVLSILWLTSYVLLRALHVYMATPFNDIALWQNGTVQLSLTLLWVSLACVTMSLASRKQLRPMWILGGSILVLVTLKLVLFDLAHIGTLTRVISFLGAGFMMLIIAYIAPIPQLKRPESNT